MDMPRKILIEHNGTTYYGDVMKIKGTRLGNEDHGILTAWVDCAGDRSGIGVGGYSLDDPVKVDDSIVREPTAYGLDFLVQVMKVVGVSYWEKLPGNHVVVLFEREGSWGQTACGIANVVDDDKIMIFKEHYEQWAAKEAA
jgi:hypothetical protein